MYQVIKMFGDWEPWWFLDDWQDDIIEEQTFEYFEEAVSFYKSEFYHFLMPGHMFIMEWNHLSKSVFPDNLLHL